MQKSWPASAGKRSAKRRTRYLAQGGQIVHGKTDWWSAFERLDRSVVGSLQKFPELNHRGLNTHSENSSVDDTKSPTELKHRFHAGTRKVLFQQTPPRAPLGLIRTPCRVERYVLAPFSATHIPRFVEIAPFALLGIARPGVLLVPVSLKRH